MTRVLTYGTFDMFHIGHLRLLQRAAAMGDELYVGLSSDHFNECMKRKYCVDSYEVRRQILEALRCVTQVFTEDSWEQKAADIQRLQIDVLVMGDDWGGHFDHLRSLCQVAYLPRTPGVSSTLRRQFFRPADPSHHG